MSNQDDSQRYELLDVVGRGGMATVWRARDTDAEMQVALKVLHEHLADEAGLVEAFEREAQLIRQIDDPGVIRIFELTQIDGRPAIAMELCEGGQLTERLRTRKKLSENEMLELIHPVLEALASVHEQGILHRDIKPDNILFDLRGRPKLIDFGIGQAEELMAADESGQVGTVEYMAPERVDGFAVDARSDIYSIGVTMFELLCGHPPYRADTASEVVRMHREADVADPRAFSPEVSETTATALMRAMAKHPEQRFDSVQELMAGLAGGGKKQVELQEHSSWEVVKEQYGTQDLQSAPIDRKGHEWVVYIPPAGTFVLYGPQKQTYLDVLASIADEHSEYIRIEWGESTAERRRAMRRRGIARGLSKQGARRLVEELDEYGIVARMAKRPRTRRVEPVERWLGALRVGSIGMAISMAVIWLGVAFGVAFWADVDGATTVSEPLRLAVVVLGAMGAGLFAGTLALPSNYRDAFREWWTERYSRDYVLDFCIHQTLADGGLAVDQREYRVLESLQSPRICASFDRAINAALHLDRRPEIGDDHRRRLIDRIAELGERIAEVESKVVAIRPAELTAQIRNVERRIDSQNDVAIVEELMDDKAKLRRRLTERDAAQQRLQTLAQKLHDIAGRLEAIVDHGAEDDDRSLETVLEFDDWTTWDDSFDDLSSVQQAIETQVATK